jgi:hypothetical protein
MVHESWEKKIKERKEKSDVLANLCEKEMKKNEKNDNFYSFFNNFVSVHSSNVFD